MSEPTNDPYVTNDGGSIFAPLPPPELKPEMVLKSRYKLIKEIGRGGMGVVWKAEDQTAERMVVLKFVPRELQNFEAAVKQVKESFQKIHTLEHTHICKGYQIEDDATFGYYLVMKWLDGETLDKYVTRTVGYQKPLPLDEVVRILRPVAEALDYAHSNGIIHRDIKPSNIFLVLDEAKKIKDVQVIDFGIASEIRSTLTRETGIRFDNAGTRPYMAPEQWRGNRKLQTGATDQYALAVVAYELLSGYPPFDSDDLEMLRLSVLQDKPEPIAEQPEHVNAALMKALSKDGINRFGSCGELVGAVGATSTIITTKPGIIVPSIAVTQDGKQAGERMVLTINSVKYPFRWCPAGTFMMGSPATEPGRSDNETQHEVILSKDFWMLETQVTQEMWESVMGNNPSNFKGANHPVEQVSWQDCQRYIHKLNSLRKAQEGYRFSLPTEAQWEYACRAGTTTAFHFGNGLNVHNANFDHSLGTTVDVGSYPANAWGLRDMHGNVWEWCADWHGAYPGGSETDPVGPSMSSYRSLRGGGWSGNAMHCRSASRYCTSPMEQIYYVGFRLSLVREN